jgi:exopolyphosphatase/guanosine-5'-triphosphate,3'-diphosphate pyrophosphatase
VYFVVSMPASPVAVIDIGSNSIKVLIAARGAGGKLAALNYRTIDARISAGISRAEPHLTEDGMARGLAAIRDLLTSSAAFSPGKIILVATSAVRDALNGADFIARVQAVTGHRIRLLSGEEEANLIGRGLTCDPALTGLQDFYVFDLGGGSLECLAFRGRRIEQAVSLRLGCVRLAEKFLPDLAAPFSVDDATAIAAHTRTTLAEAGFNFSLPATAVAVGTGGTLTTVRTIAAARTGCALEVTPTFISTGELRELLTSLGTMPLVERKRVPGLPPARADVFPTALATVIALAAMGGFSGFENSLYNLRWGLAAEAL